MTSDAISPFGEPRDTRPRALFYSYDSLGLGHIRRVLALAGELARCRPDVAMLALTSSFFGGIWQAPDNLDLIKLPSLSRKRVYEEGRRGPHSRGAGRVNAFASLRERLILEATTSFDPWLFVVDNDPMGMHGSDELVRTLETLRAGPARTRTVAGLRDIFDSPKWVHTSWPRRGMFRVLEELYDQILIYGDPVIFDSVLEYRIPPEIAAKIVYTGYIRKNEQLTPPEELRASLGHGGPLVVVTTGGGTDGTALVHAWLVALEHRLLPGVASFVVAGSLRSTQRLAGARVEAFEDDLLSWINAADLVVSMAGYNTVTEALGFGRRMLVVPRIDPAEQLIRATRMAERGLLRMLHPSDLTPQRLAREALEALAAPPPLVDLDFGGLERAGQLLADGLR